MSEQMVWVRDTTWTKLPAAKRCRDRCGSAGGKACGKEAFWGYRRSNGLWAYCEEHMYGRRVRDGIVEVQVLVGSPAERRGYV